MSFDAFCRWWVVETARTQATSPTPTPARPPPSASALSLVPTPGRTVEGSVVEAALLDAGVDAQTSTFIIDTLHRSGTPSPPLWLYSIVHIYIIPISQPRCPIPLRIWWAAQAS